MENKYKAKSPKEIFIDYLNTYTKGIDVDNNLIRYNGEYSNQVVLEGSIIIGEERFRLLYDADEISRLIQNCPDTCIVTKTWDEYTNELIDQWEDYCRASCPQYKSCQLTYIGCNCYVAGGKYTGSDGGTVKFNGKTVGVDWDKLDGYTFVPIL